jgi:signal transduction histidine kinase
VIRGLVRAEGLRPLDRLTTIKLKLAAVIVAAVLVTVLVVTLGSRWGLGVWVVVPTATVLSLAMIQVLARGMTAPLRDMVRQAARLAAGETHEHVTATSRDEVGDLARAFNHMADQVAAADRMRRDLVANVSHELRTPISALHGVIENLLDGVEQPTPEVLGGLLAQISRLERLVAQLLDLSRMEAGVTVLDRRTVRVRGLVDDAVVAATLGRDSTVVVDVRPRLAVDGDPERLHQVLTNVLGNALRHSPPDAPVQVAAQPTSDGVRIAVTDRGPGIVEHDAERVFERFVRTDGGRAAATGGAGLGLAIARWIVDLHGGSIRVDRDYRDGCRMLITLPRAAPSPWA